MARDLGNIAAAVPEHEALASVLISIWKPLLPDAVSGSLEISMITLGWSFFF